MTLYRHSETPQYVERSPYWYAARASCFGRRKRKARAAPDWKTGEKPRQPPDALWACCWCRERVSTLTDDHLIPRAAGGSRLTSNVAKACAPCNNAKGDALIDGVGFEDGVTVVDWDRARPHVARLRSEWDATRARRTTAQGPRARTSTRVKGHDARPGTGFE